ncbi:hypothetical protein BD413DRAFT_310658 [Trametes elegans]|nr:hypothetical protein BD413DRAFT_310658 [Trametes elegans]
MEFTRAEGFLEVTSQEELQVVNSELQKVWQEYHEWEQEYCAEALASLAVEQPSRPGNALKIASKPTDCLEETRSTDMCSDGNASHTARYVFEDGRCKAHSPVTIVEGSIAKTPSPYPSYESCAPIGRSILHGDDSNFMPFLPFADDPEFDHEDHAQEYRGLVWQQDYRDPDTLEIVLETARRLRSRHGLLPRDIDRTGVLPFTLQTADVWSAIWTGRQSDSIHWPGSSQASEPPLPDVSPPQADNLRGRIQDYLTLWCPSADCLEANCFSHNAQSTHIALDGTPFNDGAPFRCLVPDRSCGENCILVRASSQVDDVWWDAEAVNDLKTIAHVVSPSIPCDLAVMCRKPCYEIALLCRKFHDFGVIEHAAPACPKDDSRVPAKRARGRPRKEPSLRKAEYADTTSTFVPNDPCSHTGPCGPDAVCVCYLNKAHCSRNCRCAKTCLRRWAGCQCVDIAAKASAKFLKKRTIPRPCAGGHCPCRKARRECDPELCSTCCTSSKRREGQLSQCADSEKFTQGASILFQRREHVISMPHDYQRTEVKQGKFGLGLFLLEDAKEGDLIVEYVGELIYEPTFLCRSQVAAHVGRSYVFGLNDQFSVDATLAGNPARFINHAPTHKTNVAVSILLVNGDHRIGVFARKDISSGTELFLDYGPEYPIYDVGSSGI